MPKEKQSISKWREFEKLVALLESHLTSKGAIIKSPDYIDDRITGEKREVDISIRYMVGSTPILVTIECRNRASMQDTTWIEQLAQKRDDIRASATIAVSSRGFTKPAIEKAKFYNIETRLLSEVSEDAIKEWAQKIEIVLGRGRFLMGRLGLRYRGIPVEQSPSLTPEIIAGYNQGDVEYKFLRRNTTDKMISIGDLLREHEGKLGKRLFDWPAEEITLQIPPYSEVETVMSSTFPSLFDDIPIDGEPVTKIFSVEFDPFETSVDTVIGLQELEHLEVELQVFQQAYPSRIGRLLSYTNFGETILNIEERVIPLDGKNPITVVITGGNKVTNQDQD